MTPPTKKIITVFGATGHQGGSIVSTFLNDPVLKNEWAVRAVTRDATKASALELAKKGVEVVSADLNDKSSLLKAMTGSHTVFGVTNYWEKCDMELEIHQGKDLADAAKESGIEHYIWSCLWNVTKLSGGKLAHVYHFDSKAQVAEYVAELGIPASYFMPGFYMSNLPGQMLKQSSEDNTYTLGLPIAPTAPIPLYDTRDTGLYVKAIVSNRNELLGKRLLGATAYMTGQEIVDGFKNVFPEVGATATYFEVPEAAYRSEMKSSGVPDFIAEEMYQNMRLMEEFGYYGGEALDGTYKLVDGHLTTWEEHAKGAKAWADLK
ncbi:NmrA-like family protein [Hypoxylon rubiginosum]|uniref:NmrA-like family protein n=1 Tax=Hypoxylon rubiginosum TaxID=110542 RepID=A0ACC0CRC5_9PEZI|nr:NmrA-like family protein [Hypoxylon rubiginosum]